VFSSSGAQATAARALREHPGGTVLVVATGPVLAQMVRELTGDAAPSAAADEPDLIYMVSIPRCGPAHLLRFRL
jgi:hypothetical protein